MLIRDEDARSGIGVLVFRVRGTVSVDDSVADLRTIYGGFDVMNDG